MSSQEHFVTIFRRETMHDRAQSGIPDFIGRAKKYIGSYWERRNSRIIGSGLSDKQKEVLLDSMLTASPGEREWKQQVQTFFTEFCTEIPPRGLRLNITLTDPKRPFDDANLDNIPVNKRDYLIYKHALGHPRVAESQEKCRITHDFYIVDPRAKEEAESEFTKLQRDAMAKFLSVKDKADLVSAILVRYGHNPDMVNDQVEELQKCVISKPEVIVAALKDKNLEIGSKIKQLVAANLLKVVDSAYFITDSQIKIGNDETEAILWFGEKEKNGNTVTHLLTKLQEHNKGLKDRAKK